MPLSQFQDPNSSMLYNSKYNYLFKYFQSQPNASVLQYSETEVYSATCIIWFNTNGKKNQVSIDPSGNTMTTVHLTIVNPLHFGCSLTTQMSSVHTDVLAFSVEGVSPTSVWHLELRNAWSAQTSTSLFFFHLHWLASC